MPIEFKAKMSKGEVRMTELEGGILALKWMDKRTVTMQSTVKDSTCISNREDHVMNQEGWKM